MWRPALAGHELMWRSLSRGHDSKRSAVVVPTHLQTLPKFFVRDVQVALRLVNARVSEHQLNDPDVDAVGQQSTGAFVTLMPRAA